MIDREIEAAIQAVAHGAEAMEFTPSPVVSLADHEEMRRERDEARQELSEMRARWSALEAWIQSEIAALPPRRRGVS